MGGAGSRDRAFLPEGPPQLPEQHQTCSFLRPPQFRNSLFYRDVRKVETLSIQCCMRSCGSPAFETPISKTRAHPPYSISYFKKRNRGTPLFLRKLTNRRETKKTINHLPSKTKSPQPIQIIISQQEITQILSRSIRTHSIQ